MYTDLPHAVELAAQILVGRFGDSLRIVDGIGAAVQGDRIWRLGPIDCAAAFVDEAVSSLHQEIGCGPDRAEFLTAVRALGDVPGRLKVLRSAQPALACDVSDFDAQPNWLHHRGGVLVLDGGHLRLRSRAADDMATLLAGAAYNRSAGCPRFEGWLASSLPDVRDRSFVRRWAGSLLIGASEAGTLLVAHGAGAGGKSVFGAAIAGALGDYCRWAPLAAVAHATRGDQSWAHERLMLRGRRLVVARYAGRLVVDDACAAAICSREPLAAYRVGSARPVMITPQFQVLLEADRRPPLYVEDRDVRPRVFQVHFRSTLFGERDEHRLRASIAAESSGILNWMIEGWRDFMRRGYAPPTSAAVSSICDRS